MASMAPVSWTLMWPLAAAMTPWWGRRAAAITVVLVWVPPTRKWTSKASFSHRARILARAWAQYASSRSRGSVLGWSQSRRRTRSWAPSA